MLFLQAAQLRAEGAIGASQHCLQRVVELQPGMAQGHFALGQNHAALKQWPLAEQAFLQAQHLHEVQIALTQSKVDECCCSSFQCCTTHALSPIYGRRTSGESVTWPSSR